MTNGPLGDIGREDRQKTSGLFLGADQETSPPPKPPTTVKPAAHLVTPSRQIPIARASTPRPIRTEVEPGRDDTTRLVSIVAVCVAVFGVLALVLMRSGARTAPPPVMATPEPVEVPTRAPFIPPAGTVTRPLPPPRSPTTSTLTNAVGNPSFEQLSAGNPVGWDHQVHQGEAQFSVTPNGRRGGNAACVSSSTGGDVSWFAIIAVKPNTTYMCKGWVRCENLVGGRGAQFCLHNGDVESDSRSNAITGTTDWQQVQFTFEIRSRTEVQINCLFGGWGKATGTAWFDDVEVTELFSGR